MKIIKYFKMFIMGNMLIHSNSKTKSKHFKLAN